MEVKIKSPGNQFIAVYGLYTGVFQIEQNSPVPPEDVLNVPDEIQLLPVLPVIETIPALVGTKLLIRPAFQWFSAIKTGSHLYRFCFS